MRQDVSITAQLTAKPPGAQQLLLGPNSTPSFAAALGSFMYYEDVIAAKVWVLFVLSE